MLKNLKDEQIEVRLDLLEKRISECMDVKSLPSLNLTFQKLIEEQVRRDIENA